MSLQNSAKVFIRAVYVCVLATAVLDQLPLMDSFGVAMHWLRVFVCMAGHRSAVLGVHTSVRELARLLAPQVFVEIIPSWLPWSNGSRHMDVRHLAVFEELACQDVVSNIISQTERHSFARRDSSVWLHMPFHTLGPS